MAGLYQRGINPNFTSPAMKVASSQGAGGAVPRGASPQIQQEQSGVDVSKLGGLLGMLGNMGAGKEGVFNGSLMPQAGQGMGLSFGSNLGSGVPASGGMGAGLGFDASNIMNSLKGLGGLGAFGFGA